MSTPKNVALVNSLHHGVLRVRIASTSQWEERRIALFSQALGVVTPPPGDTDGVVSDAVESEGKVEWAELLCVADIESVRADDTNTEDSRWPFIVEVQAGETGGSDDRHSTSGIHTERASSIFTFDATTESDRGEWVRALQLAKHLTFTRGSGSKKRRGGRTQAFLRFAESDSEDCDSDSVTSEMSLEQFCLLQHPPVGAASPHVAPTVATIEVSVVIANGKGISASIPLTQSQRLERPLHQIKLRALEELRIKVHDGMRESLRHLADHEFASLQDFLRHEADHFALHFTGGADLWLRDEQQPISHYIKHGSKVRSIALSLEPQSAMPFPTLELSISSTKNKVSDLSQKAYTAYLIDVHFNDMRWQVERRFKEFHKLHHELKDKYPACELPRLPPKHVFTPLEGQFVHRRRLQLEQYTRELVDHPLLSLDVLLLSFLGVVSTSRDRDLSKNEKSVIHVTALHVGLDYGDIILFSCRFGASVLQRKVTGAKYDHIGIVVPGASRNLLRILEATGEGIQVYSLKARLMAYAREVSKTIVVRRVDAPRTSETLEKMRQFVKRVDGNPYSILGILQTRAESERLSLASTEASSVSASSSPVGHLTRRSSQLASSPRSSDGHRPPAPSRRLSTGTLVPSPTATKGDADGEPAKRKYFCSSLAAAALKELGWLQTSHTSSYFWPGSFEEGGGIEKYLAPGISMSKETLVDCRIVEVGLATAAET